MQDERGYNSILSHPGKSLFHPASKGRGLTSSAKDKLLKNCNVDLPPSRQRETLGLQKR
ncbi:MAG TPA: hypothetical protein PKE30_07185 [Niabella sp.]|nr:hypothetical protein [Niabella sp.]